MSKDMKINVHHITRVEGHGNIVVDVRGGKLDKVEWQVPEAPRFFETMVVGREYSELATITSRICGICSIGHTFASLKATEAALGVKISETTRVLRELLIHGETLQSHILHVCYLVLPDLLKVNSVFPLIGSHKEAVMLVTKLHRLANELCDTIGGRTTHPVRARVGHFSMLPTRRELEGLRRRLEESVGDLKKLADIFVSVSGGFPEFSRETEYLSLTDGSEYAFYDGEIMTTDIDKPIAVEEYKGVVNEFVVPQSTAKYGKFNRESFMVGALARYNNNHSQLTALSREVAGMLGLDKGMNTSPFKNNAAQVVESVFAVERAIDRIEWLLSHELQMEKPEIKVRNGRGVGAVEVPRGVLFHDYTYNDNGICVAANCVIPTNLNHNNIQKDFEKMVPEMLDLNENQLRLNLEMLVRAYDPCISCSTHLLNLEFKK